MLKNKLHIVLRTNLQKVTSVVLPLTEELQICRPRIENAEKNIIVKLIPGVINNALLKVSIFLCVQVHIFEKTTSSV
jgi:hypothetical protein